MKYVLLKDGSSAGAVLQHVHFLTGILALRHGQGSYPLIVSFVLRPELSISPECYHVSLCYVLLILPADPLRLLAARAVAGIGAGGIVGSVWVITAEIVEVRNRAKWSQALSVTWSCSAIAGPLLGGLFSGKFAFRRAFAPKMIIPPQAVMARAT